MDSPREKESEIDIIFNMFGGVITKEQILGAIQLYNGNMDMAVEELLKQSYEDNSVKKEDKMLPTPVTNPEVPPGSYAAMAMQPGTFPKQSKKEKSQSTKWPVKINKIISYHNQGYRVLIIMRGLPGSGKSYLARQLITEMFDNEPSVFTHIFSTDDYFLRNGAYYYDRSELSNAHEWNKNRVKLSMESGLSPIIVDNTNTQLFEMVPYIGNGVKNGYFIEILEPLTTWAKNPRQLEINNIHNVSIYNIKRMLDRYENGLTVDYIMKVSNISYPPDMKPPVLRKIPLIKSVVESSNHTVITNKKDAYAKLQDADLAFTTTDVSTTAYETVDEDKNLLDQKYTKTRDPTLDNEMDVMILEEAWETGETWDVNEQESNNQSYSNQPKPPRNQQETISTKNTNLLDSNRKLEEPTSIAKINENISHHLKSDTIVKDDKYIVDSCSTSSGMKNCYRSINDKILEKIKSDSQDSKNNTNECKKCDDEYHLIILINLFKNIDNKKIKEIFDGCNANVHLAIEVIIDTLLEKNYDIQNVMNVDIGGIQVCECFSPYGAVTITPDELKQSEASSKNTSSPLRGTPIKTKKNLSNLSPTTMMPTSSTESEKNMDEHNDILNINTVTEQHTDVESNPKTSGTLLSPNVPFIQTDNSLAFKDDNSDSDTDCSFDNTEETFNVYLGNEFIESLDAIFNREGLGCLEDVVPVVRLPRSILNEINALWIESLMHQLDERSIQKDLLIKQDEDLARSLAQKEAELAEQGREPAVPDFKEIMDLDMALSVYQKDVAKWRDNLPNDLAAKLSRDKLYNLFPEIQQETLAELLLAHNNNFQTTVEVLLMSTGNVHILEVENGVNKFVVQKEMERKHEELEARNKELSETEWPFLPKDENLNFSTVKKFRNDAGSCMKQRNFCYQMANEYMQRGMTQVAHFYYDAARFHMKNFEMANSMAAVTLVQLNSLRAPNNTTIDLHFMTVKEAVETLDLFIDSQIEKLKSTHKTRNRSLSHALYFITGRGLHSPEQQPRVKPAVRKRIRERGLVCFECNPGLLCTTISNRSKMTHEMP